MTQKTQRFPSAHPWDRNFFLVMIAIAWIAILSGFINDIIHLKAEGRLHFPLIVHFHAAIFFAWLLLFTVQVWLIRKNNFALHKRLGIAGGILAVIMVLIGIATALITENVKYGTQYSDPAFVSIMLGDMLVFSGLASAGIWLRKSPSAHKRLMLMATLILTDAGFGRGISYWVAHFFGNNYWTYKNFNEGFWPFVGFQLFCPFMLLFAIGIYDLFTRKKLHRTYVVAMIWCMGIDLFAGWLYFNPTWLRIATRLIGH